MSVIVEQTEAERAAIETIRTELSTCLESRELTVEYVAERLGLASMGVDSLLMRPWSFEEAFRVASALDFDFIGALNTSK